MPSKKPRFDFRKALTVVEATRLRASSPAQLLTGVTLAPEQSLYHHLHRQYLIDPDILPEYPNDFARWVADELGLGPLVERLANLNLFRAESLASVRQELAVILAEHLSREDSTAAVSAARPFIFCLPRLVILPCGREAATPEAFVDVLRTIDGDSIAYHLFAPKARRAGGRTDFAVWFQSLGYRELAHQLDAFDPYLNSLEDTRAFLIETIVSGLRAGRSGDA